jgi:hypothetical protein
MTMPDTIFVGIASYRDPLLAHTIKSALDNSKYPERLRFGVVEQEVPERRIIPASFCGANITHIAVDPLVSRGACWARSIQMSLFDDEDWILQVDSHTIFDKGWDEYFVEMSKILSMTNKKTLISGYPRGFSFKNGKSEPIRDDNKVIGHVCTAEASFDNGTPVITIHPKGVDSKVPVRGFYIGAGCIFAPGKFVYDVPYDPYLYFNGEEHSLSARAFTHGWDVYHSPGMPVFHLFEGSDCESYRKKHWSDAENEERKVKWGTLDLRSKSRLSAMLFRSEDVGRMGLGTVRTLDEYAEFSGIDYKNKIIHEKARKGPWE